MNETSTQDREMNRNEHLEWCKARALRYVDNNDFRGAYSSMSSDLQGHSETAKHLGIEIGMALLIEGQLDTEQKTRKFIEGFN